MENKRLFVLLTILVVSAAGFAMYYLDNRQLASYGSILAAAGSFVAVIWFSGSLWYQAQQLKEQRIQFHEEFKKTHEEGRRNALLLARDILNAAETRALSLNPDSNSLSQLFPAYVDFFELKEITESDDPKTVRNAIESWLKKEGPALALMKGLKSAAEVYFIAIGKNDIDYTKEPAEFVFIYGSHLWSVPFFEAFESHAPMLAEYMVRLEPGRKAVILASYGVMAASNPRFLKMDLVKQDIKAHREKGYPVPKIVEHL